MKNIRYNSSKWYYWGRWKTVTLDSSPWLMIKESKIYHDLKLKNFIQGDMKILDGHFYILLDDLNHIRPIVIDGLKGKNKWFEKLFKRCKEETAAILKVEKNPNIEQFIPKMVNIIACSTMIHFSDVCLSSYLEELCKKERIPFSVLIEAISPVRKTQLMKYGEELYKLKSNLKNIDAFVKKYKWVGVMTFLGSPLTKKKVLKELSLLEKPKKNKVINVPKNLKKIVKIGSELSFYRSNIIEVLSKTAFSHWPILKKIAAKHNLKFKDIIFFSHNEVITLLKKGVVPKNIEKRKKKFGILYFNNVQKVISDKDVDKELKIHKNNKVERVLEIKGLIAFKGFVKGKVVVANTFRDASILKKGDILVAPETTPDYIAAMRKASAFITNQGGITSHAAIIAREFKKPCIIGTKIATEVLKDGDLVEVDAEKGIVRILKKES